MRRAIPQPTEIRLARKELPTIASTLYLKSDSESDGRLARGAVRCCSPHDLSIRRFSVVELLPSLVLERVPMADRFAKESVGLSSSNVAGVESVSDIRYVAARVRLIQ